MANPRSAGWDPRTEFSAGDTHRIGLWPANRMIANSSGRGWRPVHAALATVNGWSGTLAPVGHPCIAYCLHRPAHLKRRIDGAERQDVGTVRPRQFLVIPAHEATEWHRHGSSDMLMLYVRQDYLDAVARDVSSLSGPVASIDFDLGTVDPLLEQLALSILKTLRSPEDGTSSLYVDGLMHAMAGHLLQTHTVRGSRSSIPPMPEGTGGALRRLPDLIEAHLGDDLTLSELATEAGLSPSAFARAFSRRFGTTVHQYVLQRRIERAKHLLASTDLPVGAIAAQTGFSSQSHLATAFRRLAGLTPSTYRAPSSAHRGTFVSSGHGPLS